MDRMTISVSAGRGYREVMLLWGRIGQGFALDAWKFHDKH
jgi:hypothetical protein